MKVLMISRSTLYSSPGGDTIQIESTAKYLRKLGVEVDIKLADALSIDYSRYDLLHFFNLIRPNDLIFHARKSNKPFVLSTIYVDYSEYEKNYRSGIGRILTKLLDKYKIEYLKTIARAMLNNEKIISKEYLLRGQKRSMKWLLKKAAFLLPNSLNELNRVTADLKVTNKFAVIPNAIDKEKFGQADAETERKGVICVGRIEGRKNQLNLIKAVNKTDMKLTIIGKASPNHKKYLDACKAEAGPNVSFVDHVSQEELKTIYATAKVHILPSWFETTGLSSLEAACMGCNIVVTKKGDTEEYFENLAGHCEPDSVNSIRAALLKAYYQPYPDKLKDKIEHNYTWEVAARKTLEVYKQVLSKITTPQ